jgi:hypothetical protein
MAIKFRLNNKLLTYFNGKPLKGTKYERFAMHAPPHGAKYKFHGSSTKSRRSRSLSRQLLQPLSCKFVVRAKHICNVFNCELDW